MALPILIGVYLLPIICKLDHFVIAHIFFSVLWKDLVYKKTDMIYWKSLEILGLEYNKLDCFTDNCIFYTQKQECFISK